MDIQLLQSFLTTAEVGNVTRAARLLHVSQPTLSRQIKTLEEELGVRLFDRLGKKIRVSTAGESMLEQCRSILERTQELHVAAAGLKTGHTGLLRVGASPQLLERLFPLVLPAYQAQHPGVEVRLTEGDSSSLLEMLGRGELHVAMSPASAVGRFRVQKLGRLKIMAVGKLLRKRGRAASIDIAEVCEHKVITLRRGYKSRDLFDAACRLKALHPVIALESSAPHTMIALAQAGVGCAIVPSNTPVILPGVRAMAITIDQKPIGFEYAAAWDPNRPLPHFAQRFIKAIQSAATK